MNPGTSTPRPSEHAIEKRRAGNVLVVSLAGRLTERFDGRSLSKELSGVVVIDLKGVEAITSFAVRSWIEMLRDAKPRLTELYLARCSSRFVDQLNMVAEMDGGAQIISFFAPYRCDMCRHDFEMLLDCETHADEIRGGGAGSCVCPQCGETAVLDADPESYFLFALQQPPVSFPPAVRQALSGELARERIEKTVEGDVTRIRIRMALDGGMKWGRITEGLEGQVAFDLKEVPDASPDGLEHFEKMLRSLPSSVSQVILENCPHLILTQLSQAPLPERVTIPSAVLSAECENCGRSYQARVDVQTDAGWLRSGRQKRLNCESCQVPLSFEKVLPLLALLREPRKAAVAVTSVPRRGPSRLQLATLAAALTLVAILVAGAVVHFGRPEGASPAPPGPPPTPTPAPTPAPALLPPWVERPFVIDQDQVLIVGHGLDATEEAAVAQAREHATEELLSYVLTKLSGTRLYDLVKTRTKGAPRGTDRREALTRVAEQYASQVGATATPERLATVTRPAPPGNFEAFVQYKLPLVSLLEVIDAYRATVAFRGMTVANFFPLLALTTPPPEHGPLVVECTGAAVRAGVRVGDVVVEINSRRISSLDDLSMVSTSEWARTAPGTSMNVLLESNGPRQVAFAKPRPPPPPPVVEQLEDGGSQPPPGEGPASR